MLTPSTIERIRSAANIVDVVSEYVTLRRAGSSFRGLCPFHDDTTPSFSVSPARGICKCFACGEGGDVVHFIMKQEQLGYYDALKFLAKRYGIEVEEREMTEEERRTQNERESMFVVNEWASKYFHDTLLNTNEGQAIGLAYCRSRGFRDDIITRFRIGFSPSEYDAMSQAALKEGYKEEYLVKTGLSVRRDNGTLYDKYHGRVIFPWFGISGKIVGFGGRVLDARTKGVNQKYINSAESEIYHKAKELYGLYQAKKAISREHNVFMVEGYTDVISMHQCGIENVVANSGTALSEDQISMLHRFTNNITLLYDGDAAGQKAALRGTDMLLAHGMRIKILLLPDNDDPDSFARKHSAAEFREYVESHQVDFITFKTNLLKIDAANDPDRMSDLIRSIVESIAVVPEEIERSIYIHRCCEILKVEEKMLLNQVRRTRLVNEKRRLRDKEIAEGRARVQQNVGSVDADDDAHAANSEENADNAGRVNNAAQTNNAEQVNNVKEYDELLRSKDERNLQSLERLIMQHIVLGGNRKITVLQPDSDNSETTVVQYVAKELSADGLMFHTKIYRDMLADIMQAPPDTSSSAFFLSSSREDFSKEASSLLSNQYTLSASFASDNDAVYAEQVSRLMLDYKNLIVTIAIKRIMEQLSNDEVKSNPEKLMSLMQQQMQMTRIKQDLARKLGRY